jgi:hypothetical protein
MFSPIERKLKSSGSRSCIKMHIWEEGMVLHTYSPNTWESEAEDHEFKAILGYTASARQA